MFTQRKQQKSIKDINHERAVSEQLRDCEYDSWPHCIDCHEPFHPRRKSLGYSTCLDCGSPQKVYAIVPVPKSNYVIATSAADVMSPYSHKGNR